MPPTEGEVVPDFEAPYCDGETFRPRTLGDVLAADPGAPGGVLVVFGFAFSAVAENWWTQYARAGWDEFPVPVVGVGRDGPYALNRFLRALDLPFDVFADTECGVAEACDLRVEREGMAGLTTARRAVLVLGSDRTVRHAWVADDWISPVPRAEIEAAVTE